MLWAVFTLIAAAAQTARNAMQRELTATLGMVGATHVRFSLWFSIRAALSRRRIDRNGRGSAEAAKCVLALGDRRRFHSNRSDGDDAFCDGPALVRGGLCLHQDRARACGAVRVDLSR